jgi:ABC-type transporter Mla maintaining outer membrane lipid asymmetry permease subunit MlaE
MTNLAFYASFFVTAISAAAIYFRTKKRIRNAVISTQFGKNRYLPLVLIFGVLSGLVIFPILASVFNYFGFPASYGHGEVLIAAPVFNFLFALVIGIVGRIILSWEPMQW